MDYSLSARVSNELLPLVEQPAAYIGGEWNQLARPGDWERADVRVAIAFPDAYTIGMSHLGCQILYWLCNHTPGVCAERVYCPWIDAEKIMREKGIPLFTWDTRQPAASCDILAISLQYEMCFTNVINLLDLAGIPVRAADRAATIRERYDPNRTATVRERLGDGLAPQSSDAPPIDPNSTGVSSTGAPSEQQLDPNGAADSPLPDGRGAEHPLRGEWPIVIAGGPQADNPEPIAEFIDLIVIGDGEDPLRELLAAYQEYKAAGLSRRAIILSLARRFPFCYAPNLYQPSYHADGTLAGLVPLESGLPARIERAKTADFGAAPFPRRPIVPWIDVVHDRVGIEIMRGCPQVCRFCHAGYTKRPLKYRSVDEILDIAEEAYWATGHHEIGLLSLSSADYPHLKELSTRFHERFNPRFVNLSFPSLRVDKMLQNIPWMASAVRKGSITMAVEAASDDMRRAIRKKVTDGNLLDGVREVYKAGWNRVKLYFMAGFPGERPEDIDAIWHLANAVSWERTKVGKGPAEVTASVGWLVPKPFTPLQWMAQPRMEYFQAVRDRLRLLSGQWRGGKPAAPSMNEATAGVAPVVPGESHGGYGGVAQMREDEHSDDAAGTAGSMGLWPVRPAEAGSSEHRNVAMDGTTATAPPFAQPHVDPRVAELKKPIPGRGGCWNGKKSHVKIITHHPYRSILEAVFSRGDRRLTAVLQEAWRRGARFDGWDDTFNVALWQAAFAAAGIDPDWYAHRERSYDECLPWDHIGLHMSRDYLERGYDDMFTQIGVSKPLPVVSGP